MRRAVLPAAAVVLLLIVIMIVASALARPGPSQQGTAGQVRIEQVDTSAYPTITLYVSALDDAGSPRLGLGAADFAITEDGVPVALAAFGGLDGEPITSVLVIDRSGSMAENDKIVGAQEAATAFVELMRPADRAALIAFNDEVRLAQGFTGKRAELIDAIERLRPKDGTALYDAVVAGVELLRGEPGRRVLLVLSDGRDCSVPFDGCPNEAGSEHTLDEAIAYATAAGQPVAVVGLGDRASADKEGIDEAVLRRIAEDSGGHYFYAPRAGELAALYADLAGAVQREYRLTYVSPRPFYDGTRRDIAVTVGGVAAAGAYTERHLINVVASPLVGIALLLPLAGLLVLPAALRRRRGVAGRAPAQSAPPTLLTPASVAASPQAPIRSPAPAEGRRCPDCDAPLRPAARYCPRCGAPQE